MSFFKPDDFGDDSKVRLMTNQTMADFANAKRDEALDEARIIIKYFLNSCGPNQSANQFNCLNWLKKYSGQK